MSPRFISFGNINTRNIRITTNKAASIRDIWIMLNQYLHSNCKPTENLSVDEQQFPYRGNTKFTQLFHRNLKNTKKGFLGL